MQIIGQSYTIITPIDKNILIEIERAARTCYQSADRITDDSAHALIKSLIHRKHEAMLEFGPSITVRFITSRGVTHELVRHRIASFAQESTRYVKYNNIKVICPIEIKDDPILFSIWEQSVKFTEKTYSALIQSGVTAQLARSVLPTCLAAEINVKANIREWRHILKLRTHTTAHPEMKALMQPLLTELQTKIPVVFDDI